MNISAFCVVITTVLLATVSAQAFSFSKKNDATLAATETAKSAEGYQSDRFRNIDKNHDGKISEEEFLADIKAEFVRLDQDKDKNISSDELDLPQGLSAEQKASMRLQMKQRDDMMKQQEAERKKHYEEDMKRMQAQSAPGYRQPTPQNTAAAKTEPVKEEPAVAEKIAPATPKAPLAYSSAQKTPLTYTSAKAEEVSTGTPAFSSTATKVMTYTSSAIHNRAPGTKH